MEKRLIKILLAVFLFFDVVFAENIDVSSEKYILYNMRDGNVIAQKNQNDETYIASLTKIMTVIVSIENIKDFDKEVTITYDMLKDIEWDVAVAGFKTGEVLTYNDLLYGAILSSGADAVNALAYSVAGNTDSFVKMMNDKVKSLGLKNTHFANVVGLEDKENYSSAYDVSQILIYALKNKKFKEVFTSKNYTFTNGKKTSSTIQKYNERSGKNISYITGGKTGYIKAAGYCLATTATINNIDYLLITLNAYGDSTSHIIDTVKIYDYYSENYDYHRIVSKSDVVVTLKTKYAKEKEIDILANYENEKYLPNTFDKKDIKFNYDGIDEVSYFLKSGEKLGKVNVLYNGEILDSFDLIYDGVLTFSLFRFLWAKKFLVLFVIIVLGLYIRAKQVQIRRKRRKMMHATK